MLSRVVSQCFCPLAHPTLEWGHIWVGLNNPTFTPGANSDLDGLLKWTDGSDFVSDGGANLPEVQFTTGLYCAKWSPRPDLASKIDEVQCNQYYANFMCEYECGNGNCVVN